MFTGIVEEVGKVDSVNQSCLVIGASTVLADTRLGQSISVNGACLTVVAINSDNFTVELTPETIRCTNLGYLRPGVKVNLERSMTLNQRLGGHLMQGHVEGIGILENITSEGNAHVIQLITPNHVIPYIVYKGFVAVDGISLTVTHAYSSSFCVSVIPYTWSNTNLREYDVGANLNIETDILAKYTEHLLRTS